MTLAHTKPNLTSPLLSQSTVFRSRLGHVEGRAAWGQRVSVDPVERPVRGVEGTRQVCRERGILDPEGGGGRAGAVVRERRVDLVGKVAEERGIRSEEHTSELQSLMRTSYAVFCLKKKKNKTS